jgi:hypothetical protein
MVIQAALAVDPAELLPIPPRYRERVHLLLAWMRRCGRAQAQAQDAYLAWEHLEEEYPHQTQEELATTVRRLCSSVAA